MILNKWIKDWERALQNQVIAFPHNPNPQLLLLPMPPLIQVIKNKILSYENGTIILSNTFQRNIFNLFIYCYFGCRSNGRD
jgi:hypothetical protein